jgi:hypothetical protein
MNKRIFRTDWKRQQKGHKVWFGLIGALLVMLLMSCGSNTSGAIASVSVSPNPATVSVKGTRGFSAVAKDAAGNTVSASFVWSSSNTAIASINASSGVASGTAVGSTTITATASGVSGSANLNVVNVDGAALWDSSTWDSDAVWGP